MQRPGNLKLFRRGLPAEFALVALIGVALAFLVLDANTKLLNPVRQAIALGLYPFQRLVLAPRDALITINDLLNVAATAKAEDEAAQKQRIELAQLATHAAQLTTENAQLKRLLGVFDKLVDQPSVVVEVLYEPANAFSRRLVFNKGSGNGIAPGMPVIDEGGVVGQVIRVTPLTSEAAVDRVERDSTSGFARAEAQPSAHPERYRHFLVLQVPVDGNETPVSRSPSPSSPNATRVEVDRASSRNK